MSTPPPTWLPTADDVAALLRARTKDSTGRELGTWSDDTRPTTDEVDSIIALAMRETIGSTYDGGARERHVQAAIGYRAACIIELSYFPEQVRSDRSPYEELKQLLDEALEALKECAAESGDGGNGGVGAGYTYHSLPVTPETTWRYYGDGGAGGYGWRHPERAATWQRPLVPPSDAEPALIDEPEPPPEPLTDIVIGHPPL